MSYKPFDETTTGESFGQTPEARVVRRLTESQGARSEAYEVGEETGGRVRWRRVSRLRETRQGSVQGEETLLAEREHVRRLLSEAKSAAESLWRADDVREMGLYGHQLTTSLRELWRYRSARETEWREAVNLLQLVLGAVEYENLNATHRSSLAKIFQEELLSRTVGRTEMERLIHLLTEAGLEVWSGLADVEVGNGEPE